MKILIVSDAWEPQVNGVVRTLQALAGHLRSLGHDVKIIGPDLTSWRCLSLPMYREIVLELFSKHRLRKEIEAFSPDTLHIATEGPLGWSARALCLENKWDYTSAYHTQFPQYLSHRAPRILKKLIQDCVYRALHIFHDSAQAILVTTPSMQNELREHGFRRTVLWTLGVDVSLFTLKGKEYPAYQNLLRPILLYVGRLSKEKNLDAFLAMETQGSKVVVGAGPDLVRLKKEYPAVTFLGSLTHAELSVAYSAADLFVFPSKSDTFGLVLLEACAAGLRIAAYPVTGPKDVFQDAETRNFVVLDDDLKTAVAHALLLPDSPEIPRAFAKKHAWSVSVEAFLGFLCPIKQN